MAGVGGRVDLAIESAEVKTIWIRKIDYEGAYVPSRGAGGTPVI
jgi:hypothetical protein